MNWCGGRNGVLLRITYVNGWPHTSLTSDASIGAMSLPVDDCTGWAITGEFGVTGAAGTVYDRGQQETVQVTAASVTSGPGNLTLPAATFGHTSGTMITTLPQSAIWATILFASAQALYPRFHEYDGPQHPGYREQRGKECRGTRRAG